jgi:hypothetical protein
MAVDNEPTPFWSGADENDRVEQWKSTVGFRDGAWGAVTGVGPLNGSSGLWVDRKVLAPLRAQREDACISDSVDTYFSSLEGAARIADTYAPFAAGAELPAARLATHPSESAIVEVGVRRHRERLLGELAAASPEVVVTLGNAALRVLRAVAGGGDGPAKLQADADYGTERRLRLPGSEVVWLALAHPAAPPAYQSAHSTWCRRRGR